MSFLKKRTASIVLFAASLSGLLALDLTDVSSSLADAFYGLEGKNEGTTGFRSLLIPMGGRAESLGGAYTGLSDDVSYIDYNPAASALLDQAELSLFHNAWIADSAMETIAGAVRKKNLGFGAKLSCFYVPFTEYDSFGTRTASSYYSETTAAMNMAYHFHPGYSFRGLAAGANLKIGWRAVPDYCNDDTGEIISGSGLEQSALAFMADVGLMTHFNFAKLYYSRDTNMRVGLSINNLGAALTGFSSASGIRADDALPTTVGAGISYKIIRPLTLCAEFRQPVNIYDLSEYQMFYAGTGACVNVTDFFSVLGGFQLKGGNPRFSLGSEFEVMKMRFNINYTLDLTSSLNPLNRISLSAKIRLGDGGAKERRAEVDRLYREGIAHFAQKNYNAAISSWEEALVLDPWFDPAIKAIHSAEAYSKMLNDIQILSSE